MERIPFNPGTVEWSGENPGMYLKEAADGRFVTLISFFRVVLSPHGRGHAALLLLDPYGDGKPAEAPNLCVTDNQALAQYLIENYVVHFGAFKGVPVPLKFQFMKGDQFVASGDPKKSYTESFRCETGVVRLTWEQLGQPFMVEMPKEKSATGQHDMFSLFVDASRVLVSLNGRGVAGKPFTRDMAGRQVSTAFLAFSETWVRR